MPQLRSYRSRRESTGSLSGMRASAGLFRDPCGELLNFGNDEASAGGAADSLLCIKKEDASYKRYEN